MVKKFTLRRADGSILLEFEHDIWFTWVVRDIGAIEHNENKLVSVFTDLVAENPGCVVTYQTKKPNSRKEDLVPFGKFGHTWYEDKFMHAAELIQALTEYDSDDEPAVGEITYRPDLLNENA